MKGRRIEYSELELVFIRVRSTWPRRELHRAFVEVFGRDDVSLSNLASLCKREGWLTGRSGRFEKGHETYNKGRKGVCAPGSEKGWFRKGHLGGAAAARVQPIGAERISKRGYRERKVNNDMPLQRRWRAVHLIEWEAAHGPIPDGHCLKCLDGDRLNTDPENWACIPRALLPRLAGGNRACRALAYDDAPPELRPILLRIAQLENEAREKERAQ